MKTKLWGALALAALAVLSFVVARPGLAEDPQEAALAQIDQGRAAFVAGKTQEAIDHLQKAIGIMQDMTAKGLASFLPAVPEGWEADEPETNSGSWGAGANAWQWNSADRTYTRKSDQVTVEVMVSSSPQMVEPQKAAMKMYRDPQMRKMMNQDPGQKVEVLDKDGWEGISIVKEGEDATIMAIKGKTMLTITVSNGSSEILKKFWNAFDLAGLGGSGDSGE